MLNGSRGAAEGAAVPLSPPDLAESALAAVAAGAGEVLVHPRTPCGRESLSPRVVGPVLAELRGAGVRVPLSVPADVEAEPDPGARLERVRSWTVLPERATVRFAEPGARELAQVLLARGVAVDAVVPLGGGAGPEPLARFLAWAAPDRGPVRLVAELAAPDPALVAGLCWLPPVPVVLYGRDAASWPVLRLAARCGAGARTGVGDVLRLPDGRPARSNAELVAAALEETRLAGATATAGSR
ncbi:3-keto-5-aminohexanoate cleavage protein [Streptomyces sp. NBC_00249]|uniref:3-keto-5-aminohexanoate cleavage protein n=1 Tax=Streptomyces sp. NBC_00249 TaxID=2975690 RepID=UPI002B1CEDE0|nr:3-keto-5-aminohexanoate cleavage protein [Streptomyces sp. NBC_00249]